MHPKVKVTFADKPSAGTNAHCGGSRAPLRPTPLVKLPIPRTRPGGWVLESPKRQKDGLTGQLGEISVWLMKKDDAWLRLTGKGQYGWEEVPCGLRGYARVANVLKDPKMLA